MRYWQYSCRYKEPNSMVAQQRTSSNVVLQRRSAVRLLVVLTLLFVADVAVAARLIDWSTTSSTPKQDTWTIAEPQVIHAHFAEPSDQARSYLSTQTSSQYATSINGKPSNGEALYSTVRGTTVHVGSSSSSSRKMLAAAEVPPSDSKPGITKTSVLPNAVTLSAAGTLVVLGLFGMFKGKKAAAATDDDAASDSSSIASGHKKWACFHFGKQKSVRKQNASNTSSRRQSSEAHITMEIKDLTPPPPLQQQQQQQQQRQQQWQQQYDAYKQRLTNEKATDPDLAPRDLDLGSHQLVDRTASGSSSSSVASSNAQTVRKMRNSSDSFSLWARRVTALGSEDGDRSDQRRVMPRMDLGPLPPDQDHDLDYRDRTDQISLDFQATPMVPEESASAAAGEGESDIGSLHSYEDRADSDGASTWSFHMPPHGRNKASSIDSERIIIVTPPVRSACDPYPLDEYAATSQSAAAAAAHGAAEEELAAVAAEDDEEMMAPDYVRSADMDDPAAAAAAAAVDAMEYDMVHDDEAGLLPINEEAEQVEVQDQGLIDQMEVEPEAAAAAATAETVQSHEVPLSATATDEDEEVVEYAEAAAVADVAAVDQIMTEEMQEDHVGKEDEVEAAAAAAAAAAEQQEGEKAQLAVIPEVAIDEEGEATVTEEAAAAAAAADEQTEEQMQTASTSIADEAAAAAAAFSTVPVESATVEPDNKAAAAAAAQAAEDEVAATAADLQDTISAAEPSSPPDTPRAAAAAVAVTEAAAAVAALPPTARRAIHGHSRSAAAAAAAAAAALSSASAPSSPSSTASFASLPSSSSRSSNRRIDFVNSAALFAAAAASGGSSRGFHRTRSASLPQVSENKAMDMSRPEVQQALIRYYQSLQRLHEVLSSASTSANSSLGTSPAASPHISPGRSPVGSPRASSIGSSSSSAFARTTSAPGSPSGANDTNFRSYQLRAAAHAEAQQRLLRQQQRQQQWQQQVLGQSSAASSPRQSPIQSPQQSPRQSPMRRHSHSHDSRPPRAQDVRPSSPRDDMYKPVHYD